MSDVPAVSDDKSKTSLFRNFKDPRKRAVLRAFCEGGMIGAACKAAGSHYDTHYYWLKVDPSYAEAFEKRVRSRATKQRMKFTAAASMDSIIPSSTRARSPAHTKPTVTTSRCSS